MCVSAPSRCRSLVLRAVAAALASRERASRSAGKPDLSIEFLYNMPLRAIAVMGAPLASHGLVRGVVAIARGWGWLALAVACLVRALTGGYLVVTLVSLYLLPLVAPIVCNLVADALFARRLRSRRP